MKRKSTTKVDEKPHLTPNIHPLDQTCQADMSVVEQEKKQESSFDRKYEKLHFLPLAGVFSSSHALTMAQ